MPANGGCSQIVILYDVQIIFQLYRKINYNGKEREKGLGSLGHSSVGPGLVFWRDLGLWLAGCGIVGCVRLGG